MAWWCKGVTLFHDYFRRKIEKKFKGQVATGTMNDEKVILLKPDTYMNLSGQAMQAVSHFYKIEPTKVTIIFDDVEKIISPPLAPRNSTRFKLKTSANSIK